MFEKPGVKTLIEWAKESLNNAKDCENPNGTASYIYCAISYLQDAIRELHKKGRNSL